MFCLTEETLKEDVSLLQVVIDFKISVCPGNKDSKDLYSKKTRLDLVF